MKIIPHCPTCFFSSSDTQPDIEPKVDGNAFKSRKKRANRIDKFALLVFGRGSREISHKQHYSKFYTNSHPKLYVAGKKYEVERKHKVKKRELCSKTNLNPKCNNNDDEDARGEAYIPYFCYELLNYHYHIFCSFCCFFFVPEYNMKLP